MFKHVLPLIRSYKWYTGQRTLDSKGRFHQPRFNALLLTRLIQASRKQWWPMA